MARWLVPAGEGSTRAGTAVDGRGELAAVGSLEAQQQFSTPKACILRWNRPMRVALQAPSEVVEPAAVTHLRSRAGKHTFVIGVLVVTILSGVHASFPFRRYGAVVTIVFGCCLGPPRQPLSHVPNRYLNGEAHSVSLARRSIHLCIYLRIASQTPVEMHKR